MNQDALRIALTDLELSQADFARLIEVTPRAITLWLSGERAVPGPVKGYLRLLSNMPANLRQVEFNRLAGKGAEMKDGVYRITFQGQSGAGMAMLVFDSGQIYGADTEAAKYDGGYIFNPATSQVDAKVKVTFPPNATTVFGALYPFEWSFDVTTTFNAKDDKGALVIQNSLGQAIQAQYAFLRTLPQAA
jgi:hypothetical protein